MKSLILQTFGWFSLLTLISSIPQPTTAQPITPAADGTGTRITPDGQRYDINGGSLSRDGANLFHSFQQFGLNQGQTANFISNPQIHNILGRVVGGDPSIINGLIQITGGNSNLFLMNPAGIVFGPNASLNIPADFTATTASGIGFGNSWFNAFGSNDYANLVGTPNAFSFNMSQLGTIINEGNLTLTNGSNLNLFANTVINTGTLATPGGNINITAVPNGNTLRISQPGHILSLEIIPTANNNQSLPQLLTGGDPIHHATTVQKLDDGTIRITGSQTPIPIASGVAVVGGNLEIGDRNRVSQQNLDINPINLAQKPGFLNILGDKIALIGASIDASGTNGGGNIHIGGNYQGAGPLPNATHTYIDPNTNITANAINSGNGGEIIIWSDNTTQFHGNISATGIENGGFVEVSGKQNLIFRGNVDLSAPNGQTGTLLLDPENITIVDGSGGADDSQLSDNQILFSDDPGTTYTISETTLESLDGNAAVELQATNNITIEDLTTDNQLTFQSGTGAITFTADADNDGNGAFTMIDPGDFISAPDRPFTINAASITLANVETTSTTSMFGIGGDITLNATGDIIAGNIMSSGDSQAGAIKITSSGGQINLSSLGLIYSGSLFGSPGNITLKAAGNITTGGIIASNVVNPGIGTVNPGHITIESTGGAIDTTAGFLQSTADGNSSGNIQLKAAGDIRTGNIDSYGLWAGTGGSISLESTGGIIDTSLGVLNSFSTFAVAGDVTLKAAGDITTGNIMSNSGQQGGNITITSTTGLINAANGDLSSNSNTGNGGNVTLDAAGNITTKSIMSFGAIVGGNVTVNSGGSFSSSEGISTYASDLISSGVGGNVDIHAASDITLGTNTIFSAISSIGEQQGGSITITSDTGKITANADIFLSSDSGTAGDVTLDAPGNIDLANILSFGEMKGGSVSITSDTSIDVDAINSYSETGQGGDVSIIAEGNITLSGDFFGNTIRSEGPQQGGNISITSNTGEINATAGNLDSYSINGIAGNVTLESAGNIATSNIRSEGAFLGGNIDITTGGSFTTTGTINSYASDATTGNAGDVNITANGNITLGGDANNSAIRSEGSQLGGNITISSTSGAINANAGNLDSYSAVGTAGSVTLDAATGIDIANIRSEGDIVGGSINITSDTSLDFTGSTLNSYSENGAAGDVSITANGDITLGGDGSNSAIRSEGSQLGGNISITSTNGEINATAGNLDSYSTDGTAGNVILDATGNIATNNIRSQGAFLGGNIDIITGSGFTTTGTINSYASDANTGEAGDVNITANSDITLGGDANNSAIRSEGAKVGGNITISSTSGAINANAGNLDSYSAKGTAGSVNLDAATGIDIANIRSEGDTVGGSINITSDTSLDFTGSTLNSYSQNGEAGDVSITANGNITLGGDASNSAIRSEGSLVGGNISITSNNGEINATAGNLDSYSTDGTAGNVILDATGNISTNNIRSQGASVGGNIDITTGGTFTTTGTINSYASDANTGNAGDVNITANSDITLGGDANNSAIRSEGATVGGNISISSNNGEINANAGNLDSYSAKGTAGSVNLDAATGIDIANIRSDGDTKGGSINITSDTSLDFTGSTLNSYSETGEAGDVSITANGNITLGGDASNSAIRSEGSQVGGNISITSTNGEINATAGNLDSYSTNGTAGNVMFDATGNIATSNIRSQGASVGGNIDITTGGTFTTTGTINSYASDANTGNAGDVNITANSDITLGGDANNSAIRSEGATVGGNISISSNNGEINANSGNLDSYSAKGTAGSVNLDAATGIDIANIRSDGDTKGGSINITSDTSLDFTGSTLNSYSETGEAGDVSITANGNITLGGNASNSAIRSEGSLVGGNISITSTNGKINATAGNLDSYSTNGMAGNVALESAGNIATSNIRSQGAFLGGNIDITTGGTFTTTGTINSYASDATAGEAGDVNIAADGNITLGGDASNSAIRSEGATVGGNINITTNTGEIDATAGNLDSYSINGTAGNVTLDATGNIATNNIRSEGASVGGNIDITTGGTFTTTGTINSYASNATTGKAGDVNVTADGNITLGGDASNSAIRSEGSLVGGNISITTNTGEINATAGNLDSYSINGTAGNVTLESAGNIATASIRSDGQQTGGIISITSNGGAIDTTGGDLSSYSDSGTAGNVILNAGGGNVTTGNIDSKSPRLGGSITITSAGDLDTSLGDLLSYSTAGVAGDITLKAAGCVTTGDIRTDGAQIAGTLSITSCTCAIDTSLGTLTTYSTNGTAGDVILDALNGVTTGDITSYGNTASGNVNIQSDSGNIRTNHIQTISPNGVAGNVTLNTFSHNGDILTANITSQGGTLAGDISVKAPDGSIKTGDIASISQSGDAGDIDVSAGEDVETGDLTSSGGNNSGDVNVNSDNGGVTTDNIGTVADNGNSGNVTVGGSDNVQTGDITSSAGNNSGNINVNSDNGGVTTENVATIAKNGNSGDVALGAWEQILTGDITSAAGENSGNINVTSSNAGVTTENIATIAQNGDSGNVTVAALDNVQTGNITSAAGNNSGDITVTSSNGGVTTENLITVADNGDSGNLGVAALDDVQTGDITSVAGNNSGDISVDSGNGGVAVGNLESGAVNGDSGNISLSGFEDVTAGDISSVAGGNSGDILVNSTTGGIVAGDIESQAASGMGGNISFDADQNINTGRIISNGALGSGDINLTSANGTITTGEIYTATGKININYPGLVDSQNMLANLTAAIGGGSSIINADALVASLEQSLTDEYSEYFGGNLAQKLHTTASIRESLNKIAAETGYKSAIVYVMAQQDQLELILFLGTGNVIRKAVPEAPREQLMATVEKFRQQLTMKRLGKRTNGYLQPSQQLYQWLITPIEAELQAAGINTLLFSMDAGLRSLPVAALHDGHQFLVEKYSMSLIPSMSLIDPRYQHLKDTRVLGMGASHFQNLGPLPAVPVELSAVTEELWQGDEYLNETFTRNNLVKQRQNNPYPIIHLATHGEFQPGLPENSYIQLWGEEKLRLNQLRELGWNNPPVELLVLSACRTALGDEQAELGFAGFAVAAGVKSALASLWYVSDEGSLALMTEFYRNLEAAKIKGEALRQAQLAMIRGEVDVTGGSLRNSAVGSAIVLPPELAGVENHELSHPYYWSAFTMIGSPW